MLASMTWTQWLLAVVLVFVCFFLILVILLQRGRGGGIASAFGGGGGSGAFGAKTGDVFTWITVVVAGVFVVLAVVATFVFDQSQVAATPSVAESGETTMFPVQVGEDGTALPVNVEQLPPGSVPPGIESIQIQPSTAPLEGSPAPADAPKPAEDQAPIEKSDKEPSTP